MPKPSRRPRWWMLAAICVVVIVVGGYFVFRPPGRIDAGPPAATPAGYRVVDSGEYRLAVPDAWITQEVTSEARDQVQEALEERAPGIGDQFDQSEAQIDGTMTMAMDPATRDNVTVVRNEWMRGDPTDPDTLEDIRIGFDDDMPGYRISGLTAASTDVHGFPAATLTYTATVGSVTVHQVMTVIQTGDHVFQVTVTSTSPARAAELSGRMVPTFDPA
jgi:hypothetical protein